MTMTSTARAGRVRKWYADERRLRQRQQVLDIAVLIWCLVCLWLGQVVHAVVLRLQQPGRQLQGAGVRLADSLASAADRVSGAPLIGSRLREPLDSASGAGRAVADVGASGQEVVGRLALVLALVVVLVPIGVVLARWLPHRLKYAREAAAAVLLRGDVELLALRAATSLPLSRLARLGPEPVARWRRGEPGAAEELAALELHRLGVASTG